MRDATQYEPSMKTDQAVKRTYSLDCGWFWVTRNGRYFAFQMVDALNINSVSEKIQRVGSNLTLNSCINAVFLKLYRNKVQILEVRLSIR